jgi:hypothetical protein
MPRAMPEDEMSEQRAREAWGTEEPLPGSGSGRPTIDVQQMLSQLQGMIDQVATATSPALREVAAKAAELAASAAHRAGPWVISIASRTDQVSQAVAGRAEQLATELRTPRGADTAPEGPSGDRPVEEGSVPVGPA